MPDLDDGESIEMQGSGSKPYVLKNVGGVYSCTCPAWRNQSLGIERRTCKHLRKLRGDAAEDERVGSETAAVERPPKDKADGPPLLLAERWDGAMNLAGWWMSEKLDGVRAYWTGKEFLSRLGNPLHAPAWFCAGLPNEPLDGEFWIERKKFQRTVGIVRRQDKSDHWKEVRFLIFDAPGSAERFEDRVKAITQIVTKNQPAYALAHAHELCKDLDHLRAELARVEALGGEGLMLRQPGSKYVTGRSATLLKIKSFHDAEATVLGHEPGAGRHKGRLGALLVKLPDGTKFAVGTGFSDAEREAPPAIGSSITFRYQELTDGGVPRFPSYVGIRAAAAPTLVVTEKTPSKADTVSTSPIPKEKTMAKEKASKADKKAPAKAEKPAAPKAAAPKAAAKASSGKRYFEFVDDKSNKFWEISVDGTDVTVRFGRIGSDGQTKTKSFADEDAAQENADDLIEEKTGKGYEEK